MKIYNEFGIKPTNTYLSAGSDYYIPNITEDKAELAFKAFEKSYKINKEDLSDIVDYFFLIYKKDEDLQKQIPNLVHLFLALYDPNLEEIKNRSLLDAVKYFTEEFVEYDWMDDKVGVRLQLNDTLFINSGIKIALDTVLSDMTGPNITNQVDLLRLLGIGVAGLYVNKSGMGNKGFDVRACLVDEDYSGFVHLSMAYTQDNIEPGPNIVYCGDKLTQMMLIPIFHTQYEEIDKESYDKLMGDSNRGDKGFGSSDVKHNG